MRLSRLILPALVILSAIAIAQTWTAGPTSPFAYTRFDGEYHPVTKLVYFLGGRNASSGTDSLIYSYNPATGAYASMGKGLPVPVSNYSVVTFNNHSGADSVFFCTLGGRNAAGAGVNSFQLYFPMSNTFVLETTDPYPGTIGGGIIQPAQGVVSYGSKFYAMGGFNATTSPYVSDTTYIFDPSQPSGSRWLRTPANLSIARGYIIPAVVDGYIYAIGGDTYNGSALVSQTIVERLNAGYLPGGWEVMAPLPTPLGEGQAFGFNSGDPYGMGNHIIVAGGGNWSADTAGCNVYHVSENVWTSYPFSLAHTRRDQAGVMITDTLYAGGNPGIWVFGGRSGDDATVLNIPEYMAMPFPTFDLQAIGGSGVGLSWHAMSGTVVYKVLRGTSSGGPYDTIGTTSSTMYDDFTALFGVTYFYAVRARYTIGGRVVDAINSPEASIALGVAGGPAAGPAVATRLAGVRPNPLRDRAEIMFSVRNAGPVRLDIYNVAGQRVRNLADRDFAAGAHQVRWNGDDDQGRRLSAGIYLVRMAAAGFTATQRMVLVR